MSYRDRYQEWLENDYFDTETKEELRSIADDETEIEDRFYTDLEFGTGGLRGIIGAGTNRINKYTIRKATQGLANYILNQGDEAKGVVIAHDSRFKSREFALETAAVLNGNGIKVYLFDELRPTPELSFAVRELEVTAGVVITASHNPPEYNGYKVYWSDGGQIVPQRAEEIIAEIKEIDDFAMIKRQSKEGAIDEGLFEMIGSSIDDKYIAKLKGLITNPEFINENGSELDIIYTPIHGTGNKLVRRALKEVGFSNVRVVSEQEAPDPEFPTVDYPNPEEAEVFNLALDMAKKDPADLIMGTDPDADRLGVLVQGETGDYISLTGNQIGILLTDYLLSQQQTQGALSDQGVIVKTIVTTEMTRAIAKEYGVEVIDTLTGFKFIGEKIKEFEERGDKDFILGFEESYGYLVGTFVRDKDAVIAATLVAEMAAYYKQEGLTLYQRLNQLMDKYGHYLEDLESIVLKGKTGQKKIEKILETLRTKRPEEIANKRVDVIKDYLVSKKYNLREDTESTLNLPEANVLQFLLEDNSLLTVRPSGTEPKIKIYFTVVGDDQEQSEAKLKDFKSAALKMVQGIID
ncbi:MULTISPECIES: phospho-sugar mutase [unclassified Candidatus Frackibacter]|uniref:phospho-sugar mutase n=1 Tax=unclassified Candidatus Frackibacter TaxID=2648818 RepID=UPI0008B48B7A|nr:MULTISPECIES: phospho-sugar mutase [unclassified Candidatus Frackibacter]SEM96405.1 alpha-phosphoglucomutase [Candidatus Frackibacter sp. WG12]SFM03974.1 alpha-phosphoglucomutase [Candidatus Frackibacter sp. WG13]